MQLEPITDGLNHKRLITLVTILTSLSITLAFNIATFALPSRADILIGPAPIMNPNGPPTISSISPISVSQDATHVDIMVTGSNFSSDSYAKFNDGIRQP